MRRALALCVVAAGCIPAPSELCRRGVELQCQRQFECQSDAVKASPGFQGGWGIGLDDCVARVSAQAGCADKATQDELCTEGRKFDLGYAKQCSDEVRAQPCADYLDPAKAPSACDQKCR